jgi:hypothetical protein
MLTAASAERYTSTSSLVGSFATRTLSRTPLLHIDKSKSTSRYTSESESGNRPRQNSLMSGILVPSIHSAPTVAMPEGHPPFSSIAIAGSSATLRHHAISTKNVLVFMACGQRARCI